MDESTIAARRFLPPRILGSAIDSFGHKWSLATHVEDVSPEEMDKCVAAWIESPG